MLGVYQLTTGFPRQETFGLSLQMRRAAMSIAINIVEGLAKRSKADKTRFLNIAEASLEETRYYLIPSEDLGMARPRSFVRWDSWLFNSENSLAAVTKITAQLFL